MLNKVTITGADDETPIAALIELSAKFPFVEWGILVSLKSEGGPRFPSRVWMDAFSTAAAEKSLAVSMHVCGEWVRRLLRGTLKWRELPNIRTVAKRVQVNTHAQESISTCAGLDWMEERSAKQFIIQLDGVNDHILDACVARSMNVVGLFDSSHGAGVVPSKWPKPRYQQRYYGYAGGLGPANVVEQIPKIQIARRRIQNFWIDMEGRVRDGGDHLDLAKVHRVLKSCAPLINQEAS
jgi:hypothetical protein